MKRILVSLGEKLNQEYKDAITSVGGEADLKYLPEAVYANGEGSVVMLDKFSEEYDGLILGGGGDMNPTLYGELLSGSTRIDNDRDALELALLDRFVKLKKPVMGICRGIQVLNVYFGGTLHQDDGAEWNEYHTSPDMVFKVHSTECKKSFLSSIYGDKFCVNSHHHQSIKDIGKGLKVIQTDDKYHCIEAVVHKSGLYFGVQWHPERLCRPNEMEEGCVDGHLLFEYFMQLIEKDRT